MGRKALSKNSLNGLQAAGNWDFGCPKSFLRCVVFLVDERGRQFGSESKSQQGLELHYSKQHFDDVSTDHQKQLMKLRVVGFANEEDVGCGDICRILCRFITEGKATLMQRNGRKLLLSRTMESVLRTLVIEIMIANPSCDLVGPTDNPIVVTRLPDRIAAQRSRPCIAASQLPSEGCGDSSSVPIATRKRSRCLNEEKDSNYLARCPKQGRLTNIANHTNARKNLASSSCCCADAKSQTTKSGAQRAESACSILDLPDEVLGRVFFSVNLSSTISIIRLVCLRFHQVLKWSQMRFKLRATPTALPAQSERCDFGSLKSCNLPFELIESWIFSARNLRVLDLSGYHKISATQLMRLFNAVRSPYECRALQLRGCTKLNNSVVRSVLTRLHSLHSLDLSDVPGLTEECIAPLEAGSRANSRLRLLWIGWQGQTDLREPGLFSGFTEKLLPRLLGRSSKQPQTLEDPAGSSSIERPQQVVQELQWPSMRLEDFSLTETTKPPLASPPPLVSLGLQYCSSFCNFHLISQLSETLVELNLRGNARLTDAMGARLVTALPKLRYLNFSGTQIGVRTLKQLLTTANSIEVLDLSNVSQVFGVAAGEQWWHNIGTAWPQLRRIDISRISSLTDPVLRAFLFESRRLQWIDVSHNYTLSLRFSVPEQQAVLEDTELLSRPLTIQAEGTAFSSSTLQFELRSRGFKEAVVVTGQVSNLFPHPYVPLMPPPDCSTTTQPDFC